LTKVMLDFTRRPVSVELPDEILVPEEMSHLFDGHLGFALDRVNRVESVVRSEDHICVALEPFERIKTGSKI